MVDMLKKSIYATIGIALMTREKAEEIGKKVAEEARLSEPEGRQFIEELLKRVHETRAAFEKLIDEKVDQALNNVNIPTSKQVEELERRVRKLEALIEKEAV